MSVNYEAIKPYLNTGFELIKLRCNSKIPSQKNWRKCKPLTRAQASAWVGKGNNIGVRFRPSDLVIDVDPRNFEAGVDSLKKLIVDFDLDCNSSVKTGGVIPGRHLYFSKPEGISIKKMLSGYPGIEFLSDGQQVVSAGSIHPDTGNQYTWLDEDLVLCSSAPLKLINALRRQDVISSSSDDDVSPELLAKMLESLDVEDFRDEQQWRNLMMACHAATSGSGLAEFVEWSTSDPSYSDHEHIISTRWDSCTANKVGGITVKTLYKSLIDAGAAHLIPSRNVKTDFSDGVSINEAITVERTANGLVKNTLKTALAIFGREIELGLAHDEFSHTNIFRAESLPWDKYVGRELNDNTERLCRVMALESFNVQLSKENTREALLAIAQMRRFNPVKEYLDSLEWDRKPRIERLFVNYFGAENSEYNRAVSKIFMVAAVRRVKEPGVKFDTVPILEGPQGSGKSTGVAILGGDWFSDANLGDITKKDSVICKQGCWIVELPELNALSRNHVDEMKAYLSRRTDRIRIPFERGFSNFDRNSVFVGTSNRSDYLRDETGNRRFWPIVTTAIKLAELESDRDQLWAEACFLEKQGESIVLAEHLWPVAANIQNQRLAQSPWTDSIQDYLDNLDPGVDRISSNELLTHALNVEAGRQNQRDARELAKVMKSLGATYNRSINFSGKSRTGYYLPKPK